MTPRSRRRTVALLASVLLLASGCGGSDESGEADGGAGDASTASPSASASEAAGRSYVALGDSYTAAPLVPETDPSDACLRSSRNYPALVAEGLGDVELTDVSCSGADSTAMIGVQQIGSQLNPAQFDALGEDTDLVTVGLGGNDFGLFTSLLADCAASGDVGGSGESEPGGALCSAVEEGSTEDLRTLLPQVESRLTAVLTGVKDRAPEARVVAVGYPRLLPDTGACAELPVARGDYDYVRALTSGLNDAVAAAAAATEIDFVDVYAASEGHDVCSADPWVNGPVTDPAAALAFHPFGNEQQAVAELVLGVLEG